MQRARSMTTDMLKALQAVAAYSLLAFGLPAFVAAEDQSIQNEQLSVTVRADGSYEIRTRDTDRPVLRSIVAAQIDHRWIKCIEYPKHVISPSRFTNELGRGQQLTVVSTGPAHRPDIVYVLRLYDGLPAGDITVAVRNRTTLTLTVQQIRSVEAIGGLPLDLQGPESSDRVMSETDSEAMEILELPQAPRSERLAKTPEVLHLGMGSQLIYNSRSKRSVLFGAVTAERFITLMHLKVRGGESDPKIDSLTIESTGTTEMLSYEGSYVRYLPPEDQVELSLSLAPGKDLAAERLMFAAGLDYHAELEAYGAAVRQLNHARVGAQTMMGWTSHKIYDDEITEGYIRTNAQWLAEHLKPYGFDHIHIEPGSAYADGEVTPNATKFPHGMRNLTQELSRLGLTPTGFVNLLTVDENSFIYKKHKEWLVRNARGEPLWLIRKRPSGPPLNGYALDTTQPDAQQYLRSAFRMMFREWGWRNIDLDGISYWAVEGYRYRPNTTALEAYRIALRIVRDAVGDDVRLSLNGGLWLSAIGFADSAFISDDRFHSFFSTKRSGPGVAGHYYTHRNFFANDPDAFSTQREVPAMDASEGAISGPLSLEAAQASIVLSALSAGARYAIGDDLPNLGVEPERLALVTNPDLLQMAKLGRVAKPLDLMTYAPEDQQPSLFFLRQDGRQSMLAVFNWTDQVRSHVLRVSDLELPTGRPYRLYDALHQDRSLALDGESIHVDNQPAQSVRLIKIIDESKTASAPTLTVQAPSSAKIREDLHFWATAAEGGVPALEYHWDFGDGVTTDGPKTNHTYTQAGVYTVKLIVEGLDGIPAEQAFSIAVDGLMDIGPPRRYAEPGSYRGETLMHDKGHS